MTKRKEETKLRMADGADRKGFIVQNPVAGEGRPQEIQDILQAEIGRDAYDLYETTGEESIPEVVKSALNDNEYAWVAAIGGDGTVSQVADGLVGTGVPLVILPAGTGNALAQEFGIPEDIESACNLLLPARETRAVDALQVGEKYSFLQIGVGLEAMTMRNTSSDQKNRWGPLAYLATTFKEALGWQPHHFTLEIDGQTHQVHASELVLANAGELGILGLEWADDAAPDDGQIEVVIIRAQTIVDYLRAIWAMALRRQRRASHISVLEARQQIHLEMDSSLPIHLDGEIIDGEQTLSAQVVPGALEVVLPDKKRGELSATSDN